jgi:hypothetical protein
MYRPLLGRSPRPQSDSDLPPRYGGVNIDPERRPTAGRLYSICALELYNHIVENANYLICGNENCRQKNFVHQQGRKKTGTAAAESFIAPTQIGAYPGHAPAEARAAT